MKSPPSFEAVEDKVREIFIETLEPDGELDYSRPLITELGFDSLDMIELSFALEEFFGIEFSSRNAITELDRIVGDDRILSESKLTDLGRELVLERMPELTKVDLPADLTVNSLPSYFTLHTFVRIIHDFYVHAPESCPESGEELVLAGFQVVGAESREPAELPAGDVLLQSWLEAKTAELAPERAAASRDG